MASCDNPNQPRIIVNVEQKQESVDVQHSDFNQALLAPAHERASPWETRKRVKAAQHALKPQLGVLRRAALLCNVPRLFQD